MSENMRNAADIKALKNKIEKLEEKLKVTEEALVVSQRRYEIAVGLSDVTIFDYDIKTKRILTQPIDFAIFGMPGVLEEGVEEVVESGIIADRSKNDLRELYHRIDNGEKTSSTTIYAIDLKGNERTLELKMISIFDQSGKPTYAVGVRKDITDIIRFRKEKEYGDLLASELTFIYEVNVTMDKLIRYDKEWGDSVGLGEVDSLSEILRLMCSKYVFPGDIKLFIEKQSPESVLAAFERGEHVITFEYRKLVGKNGYIWFEVRINIVADEVGGDVNMRVYVHNIDDKKKSELRMEAERKRYELALSKSAVVYEVNVTKDTINLIREETREKMETFQNETFAENALLVILKTIHPDDKKSVAQLLSRTTLLEMYTAGKTEISREFRRINNLGHIHWYRCSIQIFKAPQSGDILSYVYIEDIHTEKEKELLLLHKAQHDLMTGFYNKNVVTEKISEYIVSDEGASGSHAFFIIDIDYFKQVNDKFGHAFGDAVLSQTSAKISSLFRGGDILGRIGGDEFVVFMKNVKNEELVVMKAKELCEKVSEVYANSGTEHMVTVSVGIAIYKNHGKTYDELYRHSDTALYEAKEQGRNRFSIYHDGMKLDRTAVNSIDRRCPQETATFESSLSEYIFRILYESNNKHQAISSVLELVGKHYNVSRVYVFENSDDGLYLCNTFEWCAPGIEPQIEKLSKLPNSEYGSYKLNFNDDGVFCMGDTDILDDIVQENLKSQGIKSMVQFSIMDKDKFSGFIGFDECSRVRILDSKEMNDYRSFANVLGVFILEMRAFERIEYTKNIAMSVLNGLDSFAYICEPFSYRILFANIKTLEISAESQLTSPCYRRFFHRDKPCVDCPMCMLEKNNVAKHVKTVYRPEFKKWLRLTATRIDWHGEKHACLIEAMDITEFKEAPDI